MYRIRTAIFLGSILGVLSPALGQAEVWRCPQPDGTDLFTNSLKDPATCQKYTSGTELGYVYGSREATPPTPPMPPPVNVPSYQTEPQPQAPEPSPPPGYDQAYYPYYYEDYPGVYGFFLRPGFFPFSRHSHFHSAPRSGGHHGGGHGRGGHR